MQLAAHAPTPPAAGGSSRLVGSPVVRARFDFNDGSERDVVARHVIGRRAGYASIDEAVSGARMHQRSAPSKQWPDPAIAVVRDDTTDGYALLELDQTLSTWEGGTWWEASSWAPLVADVAALVNGRGLLVERSSPGG